MTDLPKAKRKNQSAYTEVHNEIFFLLENGYSVFQITAYLTEKYPNQHFKMHGIYSYIRRQRKNGTAAVIKNSISIKTETKVPQKQVAFSTEKKAVKSDEIADVPKQGQAQIEHGNKAMAALMEAGLVGEPPTKKHDDDF